MLPVIPGMTEAADGLAQAHGQLAHRFDSLDGVGRKAVAAAEQQFGIAENTGQLIIELVTQDFAEAGGEILKRRRSQLCRSCAKPNPALHARRRQGHKRAAARTEVCGA